MTDKSASELSEEEMKNFAKNFNTVIIFCEGVLDKCDSEISSSTKSIDELKKMGMRILYFSRDCSLSRREIWENMKKTYKELDQNEIISMTSMLAYYLKKRLNDKKIYVIGSSGISEELDIAGVRNFGVGPDVLMTDLASFVNSYEYDPDIGAVVVGHDEHFSYPKMLRAASYLSVKDVLHVACIQGAKTTAALVECIETCSARKALVFDDSAIIIKDTLTENYRIIPEKTLIVASGRNNVICLAEFQRFQDFSFATSYNASSSLERSGKLDQSTSEMILYAKDLTELVSRLKI